MSTRVTDNDVVAVDRQRAFRGGMSRSAYIRWLVREDGKRIERENAKGGAR